VGQKTSQLTPNASNAPGFYDVQKTKL